MADLVLPYDSLNQALAHVRALGPLVPGFEFVPPDGMRSLHIGSVGVPLSFVEDMAVAIEVSPLLTAAAGGPSVITEIRTEAGLQFVMQSLLKEIDLYSRSVRYTLGKRHRTLSLRVRRLYEVARKMNLPGETFFIPQISDIERTRRRPRSNEPQQQLPPPQQPPLLLGADGRPLKTLAAGAAA